MAVPDYIRFKNGNLMTEPFAGEWFQTTDLFGYFEKYQVHSDGTLWLTPTKVVPSERMQKKIDAPELKKIDLPEVQILFQGDIVLTGDTNSLVVGFCKGRLSSIRCMDDRAATKQGIAAVRR